MFNEYNVRNLCWKSEIARCNSPDQQYSYYSTLTRITEPTNYRLPGLLTRTLKMSDEK